MRRAKQKGNERKALIELGIHGRDFRKGGLRAGQAGWVRGFVAPHVWAVGAFDGSVCALGTSTLGLLAWVFG
jgi:hypothetical protein